MNRLTHEGFSGGAISGFAAVLVLILAHWGSPCCPASESMKSGAASGTGNSSSAPFAMVDLRGEVQHPLALDNRRTTLLFFVLHDCPISNSYAPEINRIVADYGSRGVRCFVVYVDDGLPADEARQHARDHGYQCPALLDPKHELVRYTKATVAPEVAVISSAGALAYRGRIDDRVVDFGKRRVEPTRRDLREALEAVLTGRPVVVPFTKAIGCYIHSVKEETTTP